MQVRVTDASGIAWVKIDGEDMTVTVKAGDTAYTKDCNLEFGLNRLNITAQDSSLNENRDTVIWTIIYLLLDTAGPELNLVSHNDGDIVNTATVTIIITAEDQSGISGDVQINTRAMKFISGAGNNMWESTETLAPGENTFEVRAWDASLYSNLRVLEFTLNYTP